MLCHVFRVHRSSYKYWCKRPDVLDAKRTELLSLVREVHQASMGSAGARSIANMVTAKGKPMGRWLAAFFKIVVA